ncbi:MAG: integrase [Bacteroidetes bacterium]|nr:integrase [Bacteroidota bacterium]
MIEKDLPLDDQFLILLHKKIMDKRGATKRRAKHYYSSKYRKTGIIPGPLILAGEGIMEGRKCSGRPRSIDDRTKKRFIEMIKSSSDPSSEEFIFITRKARKITTYHQMLEEELGKSISIDGLRRLVKSENLKQYLEKPDCEDDMNISNKHFFKAVPVFDLIQMDGCVFQYIKIREKNGLWRKPQVIELFDTGSRYMAALDVYFSETSENAVNLFIQFLSNNPLPCKKIRLRPDQAKGFLNLKRVIKAVNVQHSTPDGFYLQADFARKRSPKDKTHLETSHRSFHHFEIFIIKEFKDRIVKTEPVCTFKGGKKEIVTVTFLDIGLQELRENGVIDAYRKKHNSRRHYFVHNGKTTPWIPEQKLKDSLANIPTFSIKSKGIEGLMKYGLDKKKATVSKKGTIIYDKLKYYVVVGSEHFSRYKSTTVKISQLNDKLYIFEHKTDGLLLGEALCQKSYENRNPKTKLKFEINEVEQIADLLEKQNIKVERVRLIEKHRNGLTLPMAKEIFKQNEIRYRNYAMKWRRVRGEAGTAIFNAFILDCEQYLRQHHVAPYAFNGDSENET